MGGSPNLRYSKKYDLFIIHVIPIQPTFDDLCDLSIIKSFPKPAILEYLA